MNVIMLLTIKEKVAFLYEDNTVRQGLEKMRAHGYSAIPVLTRGGEYAGCVSEGDFLWHLLSREGGLKQQEKFCIRDLIRPGFNPPARIDVPMSELVERSMHQNFVPIVDDRSVFIGIVTRQDIIRNLVSPAKTGQ